MFTQRGQLANNKVITGLVMMVVMLLISTLLVTQFHQASRESAEETRLTYLDNTANRTFINDTDTANPGYDPDNWDNAVFSGNRVPRLENFLAGSDQAIAVMNDNGNSNWYTSLTIASLRDGVHSARILAWFMIEENWYIENVQLTIRLERPGGDNSVVWFADNTYTAADNTWRAVNEDVSDIINAAGTYTLHISDNIGCWGPGGAHVENLTIWWDNAALEITAYTASHAEEALVNLGTRIPTIYLFLGILLIVVIAAAILKLMGVF